MPSPLEKQPIGVRGEEISTAPCVNEKPVPVVDSGAITTSENPRCLEDPEFAAFAGKDICTNAPGIGRLVIRPVSGATPYTIAEGEKAFFSSWQQFVYDDGTIKEKNVTQKARWVSGKTTVATTEGGGVFLGKDVAADTTINIQAFYTPSAVVDGVKKTHPEEIAADPEKLVVTDACIGNAVDIVLVVDRSGSMTRDAEGYE